MYTQEDLDDAVDHGIFAQDAVQQFRAHVAARRQAPAVDEEHFRLISGFNDIFVVIACMLTLVSTTWIGATISYVFAFLATALVAWGLAECFVRRRRMALPAIVLLLAFTGSVAALSAGVAGRLELDLILFVGLGAAALAAWVHWLRFRVPMAVAVGVGALLCLGGLLVASLFAGFGLTYEGALQRLGGSVFFVCGVVAFALAMHWDMQDTRRVTDKSDIAFWLHMLAAPLLVHPVFSAMTHNVVDGGGYMQAVWVVLLYAAIGIVSLAIDRRALMVAALSYVLVVFANLLMRHGMVNMNFAITALVVGGALLLLSVFWHRMRTLLLGCLPKALTLRLPVLR